jgi:hypothetical protein
VGGGVQILDVEVAAGRGASRIIESLCWSLRSGPAFGHDRTIHVFLIGKRQVGGSSDFSGFAATAGKVLIGLARLRTFDFPIVCLGGKRSIRASKRSNFNVVITRLGNFARIQLRNPRQLYTPPGGTTQSNFVSDLRIAFLCHLLGRRKRSRGRTEIQGDSSAENTPVGRRPSGLHTGARSRIRYGPITATA